MKIIIFTLIPVIILAILKNKGFLPDMVYYILLGIVAFIGAFFFWRRFASIIMRDNMNYQEYNWSFNPDAVDSGTSTTVENDPWESNVSFGTCVGDACCSDGLVYDTTQNKCVTGTESFITESMANTVLTKTQPGKFNKIDYDLRQPQPFNK